MFKLSIKKISHLAKVANKEMVGIELGTSQLKIVKVATSLNKIDLLNAWTANTSGASDEEISGMIRSRLSEMDVRGASIFNIAPSNLVITKNIEIPSTNPAEIKDIIALQAGRHTPYSREEIIVDYVEIGVYKNNYTKILLVIVARNAVKRQVQILEKAGLKFENSLLAAEGIASSISRVLKLDTQNAPVACVHIDEATTDFIIVFKNRPIFIRSLSIGILHLLDDRETYETKFIEELKRSLEAYQNEDIEKIPSSLALLGAIEQIKDLENTLNNSLHIPVNSLSYLKNVSVAQECMKEMSSARRISFFDCLGPLASLDKTRVNLVPEEIRLRKVFEERSKELIKTGILVLTLAVLIFSVFLTKVYVKSAYLKKLDERFNAIHEDARAVEANFSRIDLVKEYLSSRGYSLEVLAELYNIISVDLLLSDIRFDDQGKFSIKGTAEAMSSVFSFAEKMSKTKYFKDVKNRYTTKRKQGLKDVTDFEIICGLVKND